MNSRTLFILIAGSVLGSLVVAASTTNSSPSTASTNQPPPSISSTQSAATAATLARPAEVEPTEAEMRQALQNHIDDINASMRPTILPPPTTTSPDAYPPPAYGPHYNNLYKPISKDSQYENWTDVAHRAGTAPRLDIVAFKKIRCTFTPGQPWFVGEYIAELRLTGSHPAAQEILQTSGKPTQANFFHADTGWIWSPAR